MFPGVSSLFYYLYYHRYYRRCGSLALLCLLLAQPAVAMQVVFISPGKSNEPFWVDAAEGLQHAAGSLGIELEILYAERNHLAQLSLAREVVGRPAERRPDYLLVAADKQTLPGQLEIAERAGVRVFSAYNGVQDAERGMLGYPREHLHYWLGSLVPNAQEAGYLTAQALIRQGLAQFQSPDEAMLEMLAISGDRATDSSRRRTYGMELAVAEYPQVTLRQTVYADWQRDIARYQTPILLKRYPRTRLLWTGSDLMAFGALEAIRGAGLKPARDLLVSTVNMTERATRSLLDGELQSMAGGHHLAAAWALVVLYDYDHGVDFAESEGLEMERSMFALFDPQMAEVYLNYLAAGRPQVNYCRFSKVCNPARKEYDFSIRGWLQAAEAAASP